MVEAAVVVGDAHMGYILTHACLQTHKPTHTTYSELYLLSVLREADFYL